MGDSSRYTRADVADRDGQQAAPVWVIIKDNVYDVTNYIHEHPGGGDLIMEHAGQDASKDFERAGHSADARTILAKHRIGEIVEEEKYYDANGKKKKRVVSGQAGGDKRSCLNIVTCGLLG